MFRNYRGGVVAALVLTLMAGALAGCPRGGNNIQFALLVEKTSLDFGADTASLSIKVRKSVSTRAMTPLLVTPNVPWVFLESPLDPSDRISSGPSDSFTLVFTVNRAEMEAGVNAGSIVLSTEGAPPITVSVTAIQRLVADFSVDNPLPLVGQSIQFTDESDVAPGEGPILTHLWDFGDGTTSPLANPMKTYAATGSYTVSLTVTTANAVSTKTEADYITVGEPAGPEADFSVNAAGGLAVEGQPLLFTNLTVPGSASFADTTWFWDFGDGTTSTDPEPAKVYNSLGSFTVSLTATNAFGTDTETKTNFITIAVRVAPTVDFSADPLVAIEDEEVEFTPAIVQGSLPVLETNWSFGDGGASSVNSPSYAYDTAGVYTVTLEVVTAAETITATKTGYITVLNATALDRYVRKPDNNYSFQVTSNKAFRVKGQNNVTLVDMVSQAWRSSADIYRIYNNLITGNEPAVWRHKMAVALPGAVKGGVSSTALLIIDDSPNTFDFLDQTAQDNLAFIADSANSIAAVVTNVPNQPIVFTDDINTERYGHNAVAYSFEQFLADPQDEEWPMLLPMTKSVVRAMDTVQTVAANQGVTIDGFVLVGHNLGGWTAWLTAAADPERRVSGIVPMGSDLLNFEPATDRHLGAYGLISPALADYDTLGVFGAFGTIQGDLLLEIVDPIGYAERLTQPKYIINGTNDEFWLPDAAEFYFTGIPGDNALRYLPNEGNDLDGALGSSDVVDEVVRFFNSISEETGRPSISVTYGGGGAQVTVITSETPASVAIWSATDATPAHRDYRTVGQLDGFVPTWISAPLNPVQANTYVGQVTPPGSGWIGYFVEVTFNDGTVQCTEVRVLPNTLPF